MPNTSHAADRTWLNRIWHLPDRMHWMDPLPPAHRRGIIAAVAIVVLALLWPADAQLTASADAQLTASADAQLMASADAQRTTSAQNGTGTEIPLQAEIVDSQSAVSGQNDATRGEWRSYTISAGQTLAQLFRDNNLPVNDVFAMADVEGSDKPLSTLQAGQQIKIRQNAAGAVTALTLASASGEILFTRQPNGTFIRAR